MRHWQCNLVVDSALEFAPRQALMMSLHKSKNTRSIHWANKQTQMARMKPHGLAPGFEVLCRFVRDHEIQSPISLCSTYQLESHYNYHSPSCRGHRGIQHHLNGDEYSESNNLRMVSREPQEFPSTLFTAEIGSSMHFGRLPAFLLRISLNQLKSLTCRNASPESLLLQREI